MSFIIQPATSLGTNSAVATGTIPDGATVIMKSDGTVSAIATTINNEVVSYGSTNNIPSSTSSRSLASVYDVSQNKIVIIYNTSFDPLQVIVGTVSGSTITFGTPVSVGLPFYVDYAAGEYDPINNKSVFAVNYDTGAAYVGGAFTITVSGTVPTIGVFYTFGAGAFLPSIAYDTNAAKFLISYNNPAVSQYGFAVVATVTGSVITYGTPTTFNSSTTNDTSTTYSTTAQKSVISFLNNSSILCCTVATISGTSVSFGTQLTTALSSNKVDTTYDATNDKIIIAYGVSTAINYVTVGTISGTNISLGTSVILSSTAKLPNVIYNPSNGKIILTWINSSPNNLYSTVGTVSGSTIIFGSTTTITSGSTFSWQFPDLIYNSNLQKVIASFAGNGVSSSVQTFVGGPGVVTNLTTTNFFGFSTAAYTTGSIALINTIGAVNTKQTGLTAGLSYYVQNDGTLATTAASPSVNAGLATSATSILIKG